MKVIPILMFHGYRDRYDADFNYLAENGYVTKHLNELTNFFINPEEHFVIDVLREFNYAGALRAELNANEKWNQYCIPRWNIDRFQSIEESLTNISEI